MATCLETVHMLQNRLIHDLSKVNQAAIDIEFNIECSDNGFEEDNIKKSLQSILRIAKKNDVRIEHYLRPVTSK